MRFYTADHREKKWVVSVGHQTKKENASKKSYNYYPFGLQTANSWTRDNTTANNFLANGGTELNPTSALYDLEFRNYDPILGRMHQVDPMTDKYSSLTPYNYAFNSPVVHNDPNGADPPAYQYDDNLEPTPIIRKQLNRTWDGVKDRPQGTQTISWLLSDADISTNLNPDAVMRDGNGGYYQDTNLNGIPDGNERLTAVFLTTFWSDGTISTDFIPLSENEHIADGHYSQNPLNSAGPDRGYFDVNMVPINGNTPDYRGVFISAKYNPSSTDKFTDYNWVFWMSSEAYTGLKIDPNNFVNEGPFYYGEPGHPGISDNSIFDASEIPNMTFTGVMTLYGKEGGNWTQIGSVEYGFSYKNGTLDPIIPAVISYTGK